MLDDSNAKFLKDMAEEYMAATAPNSPNSLWNGQIVLVSDDEQLCHSYRSVIEMVGGRLKDTRSSGLNTQDLSKKANVSSVIFDVSDWGTKVARTVKRIEQYCETLGIPLLLRVNLADLDDVLVEVPYDNVEHLLSDDPAELLVSLKSRLQRSRGLVFSDRDEVDLTDLKKISEDVDRIARALVQLSGPDLSASEKHLIRNPIAEPTGKPAAETKVSDAAVSFKAMDQTDVQAFGSARAESADVTKPARTVSASQVRNLIKARRLRDQYFEPELFADPAWDMLLDLMAARLEGAKVSVSSLCIAASVPPTTALRWIKTMTEEKIFLRKADEKDGRRIFIELSDEATAGMIGFFSMIHRNNLMIVSQAKENPPSQGGLFLFAFLANV